MIAVICFLSLKTAELLAIGIMSTHLCRRGAFHGIMSTHFMKQAYIFCDKENARTKFPRNIRLARVKTALEGETHGFEKKPGIEKTDRFDEG
jgi:hypothetical protein